MQIHFYMRKANQQPQAEIWVHSNSFPPADSTMIPQLLTGFAVSHKKMTMNAKTGKDVEKKDIMVYFKP